ncbi:multidrug and toxin extrusion protein 1-like [Lates calcarifer]|uniref:Multidrug and toxin extrusion protein n=1 Tax=Lates calcarifer TaxID=8187 RepID=A0AAJ8B4R8_LATCA|nr:multidrug and toxin extrusion protein 1-like [Lates calcarifer]
MDDSAPATKGANGASTACEVVPSVQSSGECGFIPLEYRNEIVQLVKLAGPVVISQLMVFMITITSLVFCGHMGKTELAGVSLAAAVVNVTGISIGSGLSSTCDTLISQTYGSGNLKRVGVILQRGVLILLLACFPCWAVLINTEPLLLAVKQSPEVASLSQLYVKIIMPALPAAFMYQLQGKYLQNQGIIWPQVITGAMGNGLNAIINYIFLYPLEWGVTGSAAANAISQYLLAFFLYVYICWRGLHKATWGGWSLDCLQEWGPFIKLAIPSMLMICLSWWIFEIGGFLAGVISEFPLGFSIAASVRVGNALGAGNTKQAKLSCKVSIMCAFMVACFVGASLSIAKNVIGYIFTSEQDIIKRVSDVMLIFGFMHVGDATAGVAAGVLRGAGKQLVGALCNLVGYYFIGFPIGVSLMFAANMGIVGLWTGLTILCVTAGDCFHHILCSCESRRDQEVKEMVGIEHPDSDLNPALARVTAPSSVRAEEGDTNLEMLVPGRSEITTTTTVGDVLSVKQLVLRRGLTLFIMIIILVSGIVTSNLLVKLLK